MSGVLRPLLLNLAAAGLFKPVWSSYIGLEWRRNAARLWPINRDLLNDEWEQMQQRFPQACFDPPMVEEINHTVFTDNPTKPLLRRSDAKDHHVIMAGVRAHVEAKVKTGDVVGTQVCPKINAHKTSAAVQNMMTTRADEADLKKTSVQILTWNIRDFNRTELRQLHLGLLDPDQLLSGWWADHRELITHHLEHVVQTLIKDGRRQPAPISDFLHRERLFRFKQLYVKSI
jgi:hypothetical protein